MIFGLSAKLIFNRVNPVKCCQRQPCETGNKKAGITDIKPADEKQNKKAVVIPIEEWQSIFEELQDYYDVKESSEILKRIEAGKEKTYSMSEVFNDV